MGQWCGWAVLLVLAACGGKAADPGSSGVGGSASAGSSGADPAPECSSFVDDAALSIPITIVNSTKQTLYVAPRAMPCDRIPPFEIRDDTDTVLTPLGFCRTSCENQMSDNPSAGCPAICLGTFAITLEPGEGHTELWSGLSRVAATLPHGCFENHPDHAADSPECDRAQRFREGGYTFTAHAGTSLACDDSPEGCPACEPAGAGGCLTPNAVAAGRNLLAKTSTQLHASGPAEGVRLELKE